MRLSRVQRTVMANVYGQLVTLFIQLATIPLFISYWGTEKFSTWLALMAFPNMIAQSLGGIASSSGTIMIMDASSANCPPNQLARTYNTSIVLVAGLTLFLLLFSALIGIFLPIANSAFLAPVVTTLATTQLLVGVVVAGYQASKRFATGFAIQHTTRLLASLAGIVALVLDGEFVAVATSMLLMNLLAFPISYGLLVKTDPRLFSLRDLPTKAEFKRLLKPFAGDAFIPIGQSLRLQGPIWIMKSLGLAESLVAYSTLQTMANSLFQVPRILNRAMQQELSVSFGERDSTKSRQIYFRLLRFNISFGLIGAIGLLLFGEIPFSMLVRGKVEYSVTLLAIILVATAFSIYNWVNITLLKSVNQHFTWATFTILLWGVIMACCVILDIQNILLLAGIFAFGEALSAFISKISIQRILPFSPSPEAT